VRGARSGRSWSAFAIAVAFGVAACASDSPPSHGTDPASGFPRGVYAKEIDEPELGRIRLEWVFAPDGRWAEVPVPLDGQPQRAPVARGTYRVDGDAVTVAISWPPGWGTSTHRWRLDGDALWTTFVRSDVDGDAAWFGSMDIKPWRPVP
jgi:hypothetical protein